jgi:hypothetical protein
MGALIQAVDALKILATVLDMVPVIGSNLKAAADLGSDICEKVRLHVLLRSCPI